MFRILKDWTLPIAMAIGILFHRQLDYLSVLIPYLIFAMLLLTFCKISPREIRFVPLHGWLLLIQLGGCVAVYAALVFFNPIVAQAALVCVLAPTATSAVVIVGMLGGDIAFLATYTLAANIGIALFAPVLFSFISDRENVTFFGSVFHIFRQIFALLMLPMLCAWFMRKFTPGFHRRLLNIHQLSFYLWAVALTIVIGKTVVFLIDKPDPDYWEQIIIALVSLVICVSQFLIGRALGKRYGDVISAGQGLGQKNTVLAIWMAQTYLNPIASIGPAAYVVWQNLINAYQLWLKRKHK